MNYFESKHQKLLWLMWTNQKIRDYIKSKKPCLNKWQVQVINHLIQITYYLVAGKFSNKKSKWKAPKTNYAVYATIS